MDESLIWVTHSPLHLIIDSSLELKAALGVVGYLELQPMPFLPEILVLKIGLESHIRINRE